MLRSWLQDEVLLPGGDTAICRAKGQQEHRRRAEYKEQCCVILLSQLDQPTQEVLRTQAICFLTLLPANILTSILSEFASQSQQLLFKNGSYSLSQTWSSVPSLQGWGRSCKSAEAFTLPSLIEAVHQPSECDLFTVRWMGSSKYDRTISS